MDTILGLVPSIVTDYPYAFLAVGLFIAGDSVLIPAVYLSLKGRLDPAAVTMVAFSSMLLSDYMWYWIGGHLDRRVLQKMVDGRIKRAVDRLSGAFSARSRLVLYLSKLVYGTRIAAEILAAASKMKPWTFLLVDAAGVATLLALFFALGYAIDVTTGGLESFVHGAEVALLIFVAVIVLAHLVAGSYIKKLWTKGPEA